MHDEQPTEQEREQTRSHQNSEVNLNWAASVLRTEMTWEPAVSNCFNHTVLAVGKRRRGGDRPCWDLGQPCWILKCLSADVSAAYGSWMSCWVDGTPRLLFWEIVVKQSRKEQQIPFCITMC